MDPAHAQSPLFLLRPEMGLAVVLATVAGSSGVDCKEAPRPCHADCHSRIFPGHLRDPSLTTTTGQRQKGSSAGEME